MAYIYKIINDINQKIYIGKTEFSIEKRFKEHCLDAFRERNEKRPLYSAMKKYGIEHFHIELIEETNNPEEREKYWIAYYKGYEEGYNATMGGDGKCLYNHQAILKRLQEYPFANKVAEEFGCCVDLVYDIAKKENIKLSSLSQMELRNQTKKEVYMYSKNNELITKFDAVADAARWCYENNKCATLNSGVRGHISEAARGERKSAYGYIWKYS